MRMQRQECAPVGYIQVVFFDRASGEVIGLGGAGFFSKADDEAAWGNVKAVDGESSFEAVRLDARGDICDERRVSAQTCEALLGKPIGAMISLGRAALAAELASYRRATLRLVASDGV